MTRQYVMLAIGMVCCLVAAIVVNVAAPGFETIYRDFGVELPWLTRMLLAGRWFLFALPVSILLAWWLARPVSGRPDRRALVALICMAVPVLLVPVVVIGLYLPIFTLVAYAFNAGTSIAVWEGFSLHWFGKAWARVRNKVSLARMACSARTRSVTSTPWTKMP